MASIWRSLLYLYPPSYRREYGEEMMAVLLDVQAESSGQGVWARWRTSAREMAGLVSGALQQHLRSMTGFNRAIFSPRRFAMHSEFRFPKSTAVLMIVILAAVVMAIEKATAIASSQWPRTNTPLGPIHPAGFTFLPTMAVVFAIAAFAGTVGWTVLFALRRSGVHRLSACDPASEERSGLGLGTGS
jgi:hypothetical protein